MEQKSKDTQAPGEDEFIDKKMRAVLKRSSCCKVPIIKLSRAKWACSGCGEDKSLEIVLLTDMYLKEYKRKFP